MYLIENFLDLSKDTILSDFKKYKWNEFTINNKHLSRTGCFEGTLSNGTPWLRCPSIEYQTIYPLSNLTKKIMDKIKEFGYETNIAKIQKYDNGNIGINLHSDKLIDLDINSPIFIIRFGETRTCLLKNKQTKDIKELKIPHNSMLVLSYQDNLEWQHGIKNEPEIIGESYSIVFRNSVTFLDTKTGLVYGQNTPIKNKEQLNNINKSLYYSKEKQKELIVKLYGIENKNKCDLSLYKEIIDNCIYPF